MESLILDTSSNRPFLLWAKEGKAIDLLLLEGGEKLSKELGAHIKKFLQGRRPSLLAVGTGPGSFTGIRVGVAIAKALAYGWNIPLLGFPSLLSFIPPSSSETPFAILADARMGGLYCQRSDAPGPELLPIEKASALLEGYTLFSPHSAQIEKRLSRKIHEAKPNGALLSGLSLEEGKCPLAPFPLAYLDGKL